MVDIIVPRSHIEERAKRDFAAYCGGETRTLECPFPPSSAAAADWHKMVAFLQSAELKR